MPSQRNAIVLILSILTIEMLFILSFSMANATTQTGASSVTTQLNVIGAPTLGGSGRALWTGIGDRDATAAELSCAVQSPDGCADRNETVTVNLIRGRVSDRQFDFSTPRTGEYRIHTQLKLGKAGKAEIIENTQVVTLDPPLPVQKASAAATFTLLVLNEPAQVMKTSWYTFTPPVEGNYVIEAPFENLPNLTLCLCSAYLSGYPGEFLMAKNVSISSNVSARIYCHLSPKTYYITTETDIHSGDPVPHGIRYLRVTNGPWISNFEIGSDKIVVSRDIQISNACQNSNPTAYMASESPDFKDAVWRPYSTTPIFTFSPAFGRKFVYFKVRNATGVESPAVSANTWLTAPRRLTIDGPAITSHHTYYDELNWFSFIVTSRGHYVVQLTTAYYHGSLALTGPDSSTRVITNGGPRISQNLDPGTYYIKFYDSYGDPDYSIQVTSTPGFENLSINAGHSTTTPSRIITLNNTGLGNPTSIIASLYPDFQGAVWQPYSPNLPFKLNAGNNLKTVYVKLRNTAGKESDVAPAQITLREIFTLNTSGEWRTGNINPVGDEDWYQFTVASTIACTIETQCGSLEDTILTLYGPNNPALIVAQDDDGGENYAAKLTVLLNRGTYYLKVAPRFAQETGSYSIRLK